MVWYMTLTQPCTQNAFGSMPVQYKPHPKKLLVQWRLQPSLLSNWILYQLLGWRPSSQPSDRSSYRSSPTSRDPCGDSQCRYEELAEVRMWSPCSRNTSKPPRATQPRGAEEPWEGGRSPVWGSCPISSGSTVFDPPGTHLNHLRNGGRPETKDAFLDPPGTYRSVHPRGCWGESWPADGVLAGFSPPFVQGIRHEDLPGENSSVTFLEISGFSVRTRLSYPKKGSNYLRR